MSKRVVKKKRRPRLEQRIKQLETWISQLDYAVHVLEHHPGNGGADRVGDVLADIREEILDARDAVRREQPPEVAEGAKHE